MNPKAAWDLLKTTFNEWSEDKASRLGAALAYYSVFSIAPLVIIAIAIASLIFGHEAAQGQIVEEIGSTVGEPVAKSIQELIQNNQQQAHNVWATVVGVVTLLFGATGVFGQLQDSLNTIWKVQPKPGRGVWGIIQDRFLSLTMVLGTGFLLLTSLVLTATLEGLAKLWTPAALPGGVYLWQGLNLLVTLAVVAALFALIFKVLPDVKIQWRDVWIGAVLTAVLFGIGKYLIGLYLGRASVTSGYGAAGSLVVILLWVYYSSQILLFGAEFTRVYANRYGSGVKPAENAVPLTREAQTRQGQPRSADVAAVARTRENQESKVGAGK